LLAVIIELSFIAKTELVMVSENICPFIQVLCIENNWKSSFI
jgi:hypothetical protein